MPEPAKLVFDKPSSVEALKDKVLETFRIKSDVFSKIRTPNDSYTIIEIFGFVFYSVKGLDTELHTFDCLKNTL